MKKQEAPQTKAQLKKAAHALAQRKYIAKKKGKPEKQILKIEKQQAKVGKQLRKTAAQLDNDHAHRLAQRTYKIKKQAKATLNDPTASKAEIKRALRKVTDAATDQKRFRKPRDKQSGKLAKRKKGKLHIDLTPWGSKDFADKVMIGAIKYESYKGDPWDEVIDDLFNDIMDIYFEPMGSDDVIRVVRDLNTNDIEELIFIEGKYLKKQDEDIE